MWVPTGWSRAAAEDRAAALGYKRAADAKAKSEAEVMARAAEGRRWEKERAEAERLRLKQKEEERAAAERKAVLSELEAARKELKEAQVSHFFWCFLACVHACPFSLYLSNILDLTQLVLLSFWSAL